MLKAITILFLLTCCLSAVAQRPVCITAVEEKPAGTKERPVDICRIRSTLLFHSTPGESVADAIRLLISEIERRKVNFILDPGEREYLKKVGATQQLLQAIDHNVPTELRERQAVLNEMTRLYMLVVNNYRKRTDAELKTARDAANEFIKRYGEDAEVKDQTEWLMAVMPDIQRQIERLRLID